MTSEYKGASYLLTLSGASGLTALSIRKIVSAFPTSEALHNASVEELQHSLGEKTSSSLMLLMDRWDQQWELAQVKVRKHLDAGIKIVACTDPEFPPLLRLIQDPPPILFVKGNLQALCARKALAIVGTRDSTPLGGKVARQIARDFAKEGFVIVSGLAKGIDADAHEGALAARGRTVAVLANSLDHVYPKENRPLADRIIESGGALISETPLGSKTFRSAFVQRDRIQSGMSLGVIAVQTDIEGGTMHTVRFAEEQRRLVFCPRPLPEENGQKQYAGVKMLIESGRAEAFGKDDYRHVVESLMGKLEALLGTGELERTVEKKPAEEAMQPSQGSSDKSLEVLDELVSLLRQRGIDKKKNFDKVISQVKKKLFPAKQKATKRGKLQERSLFSDN